jgi:hypothetical protein
MMPLYGFLEGDTLGILVFAYETDTVQELAQRLQQAASVRVDPHRDDVAVVFNGRTLNPKATLDGIGIGALDRFDVVGGSAHGV